MKERLSRLTDREREVLRLLVRGHDIKSIAMDLGITATAVNERLRQSRQKLGVSSSREAARILASEEAEHNSSVDSRIGIARAAAGDADGNPARLPVGNAGPPPTIIWSGIAMLALATAALAVFAAAPARQAGPPKVVATSPARGGLVAPGPLMLKVTFDRPMMAGSYSFVQKSPDTDPDCGTNVPEVSRDRRTFSLRCTVRPGRSYEVWFNSPPFMNFKSDDGAAAEPYRLTFRTRRN